MNQPRLGSAERDLIALGIVFGAIMLFVASGGTVVPETVAALFGQGKGPDFLVVNAMFLNIALVIFSWRRYNDLTHEITERKRAEAEARKLAEIDPLTGCPNRRGLARAITQLRGQAQAAGQSIAFVMVDLDNFKQINDMHGHSMGDRVLVRLAERLQEHLPRQCVLARLGGDEFAILTRYDPAFPERVDDMIMRLFERITPALDLGDTSMDITMSIGVASDNDAENANPKVSREDDLMHRADIAMYHSKKQGGNRFYWFEPAMENELRFRNELEAGIRRGLASGEFVPYYEQQIDLDSGELVGFEMLARWRSPQLGLVSPEIFIPIAEEIGLIGELSEQLITRAFDDAAEWDEGVTLSINISPVQLRDPWFAQKLLRMLIEHRMPAHRLEVEITESCLHENIALVRSMITSLRNQGVQISLDDFGTGYSSLEQLRTLPFDRIKIDRSFVGELRDPEACSSIVDAIVSLGRGLNMPITAEGIEDEQILRTLRAMGPLKGQGYLYGRPESSEQVRDRLRALGRLNGAGAVAAVAGATTEAAAEETTLVVREGAFARARKAELTAPVTGPDMNGEASDPISKGARIAR